MQYGPLKIFSGNANPELAKSICEILGEPLGDMVVDRFSDGEVQVKINDSVRGSDVFLIQSTCHPVNEHLVELLVMLDAFRRGSAERIVAVLPYYGYARQDRKSRGREPITAKLVANLITGAGASRLLSIDLHTDQIQGFFDIPLDHLPARRILAEYFRGRGFGGDDTVIVAPDVGALDEVNRMADELDASIAIIAKRRPRPNISEVQEIIGDLKGKRAIMLDDMIDTGGSLAGGARALRNLGAVEVHGAATHAILSGPAMEKLSDDALDSIVVTDTIPLTPELQQLDKLVVLSVAPLLAEAIHRIHNSQSISATLGNNAPRQQRLL
ncbi:ribose-phosphate pyrophosphokinase [bacterium]|nr:ribose-phosphate pyrophosphokinase [bacterium]